MNQPSDKPEDKAEDKEIKGAEKPQPKEVKLREISKEDLKSILEAHKKWVETEGKDKREGERVLLNGANLQEADLFDANLQRAFLQKANLQGAILSKANLEKAILGGANLQKANLRGANLQGGDLSEADLQKANLSEADLQKANLWRANLQKANLIEANLQEANLWSADLQGASLIEANLQKAYLWEAKLQEAYLEGANLQKAALWSAKVEGANFEKVNLQGATLNNIQGLHKANLQDCNLEKATGLRGTEFARADITGARLPDDIREFKILNVVEETSRNARKIFLAMLLGCVYSWLTIGSTTDVNLLTNSASSPLPIIRTAIPIAWFYWAAPALLLGFYFYLHFYLQRLWKGLAGLPAKFEDGKPLDERAYPWLLNGLVRRHFEKLKGERTFIDCLEEWVSIFLAWWVVPITLVWFWMRFLPRHDWTGTILHIILIVVSIGAGIIFYRAHARKLRGDDFRPYSLVRRIWETAITKCALVALVGVVLVGFSLGAINGVPANYPFHYKAESSFPQREVPRFFWWFGYDVFADLRFADVSIKPIDYWRMSDEQKREFVVGARLSGADLRFANCFRTFLVNADLKSANLHRADLRRANLQGAILWGANLQEANLYDANLQAANLRGASLREAGLFDTNLQGASLIAVDLSGADLQFAEGLTQDQLDKACGDSLTLLPPGLTIKQCPEENKAP